MTQVREHRIRWHATSLFGTVVRMTEDHAAGERLLVADQLATANLDLEPVRAEHWKEMVEVLRDRRIYEFTGGEPPSAEELQRSYRFLERQRSPDGSEGWLNWVVRHRESAHAIGVVQATVIEAGNEAEVAWIISPHWQSRGFGTESATTIVAWLGHHGVRLAFAHIAPENLASARVAAALGFVGSDTYVDGEQRWERGFVD